jgi:ribosomal protein S18 acetylase RimI-like enzyme
VFAIRSFRPEDTEAVADLWHRCGLVHATNDPRKDCARKQKVGAELFLIGLLDSEIIASAMAGYEGHRGSINYLAVCPKHQRHGYGRQMMDEAERLLRAAGCAKINLNVRTSNTKVLAFYRAIGFIQDDVIGLGKRLEHD